MLFLNGKGFMTYLVAPLAHWTFRNIIIGTFAALEGNLPNWLEM